MSGKNSRFLPQPGVASPLRSMISASGLIYLILHTCNRLDAGKKKLIFPG